MAQATAPVLDSTKLLLAGVAALSVLASAAQTFATKAELPDEMLGAWCGGAGAESESPPVFNTAVGMGKGAPILGVGFCAEAPALGWGAGKGPARVWPYAYESVN